LQLESWIAEYGVLSSPTPENVDLRNAAPSEILSVATRHKRLPQVRKCRAAVQHSLACTDSFFVETSVRRNMLNKLMSKSISVIRFLRKHIDI